MAYPPPSSTSPDAKGRYKQFAGAVRQSLKDLTYDQVKQPKSFWNVLAKKARSAFLDDGSSPPSLVQPDKRQTQEFDVSHQKFTGATASTENQQRQVDGPTLQRRFQAFTSSLSVLGDTIGNAIEEGLSIVESKATDFMSSDRHPFMKKAVESPKLDQQQDYQLNFTEKTAELLQQNRPKNPRLKHLQFQEIVGLGESSADKDTQLKASRDVAMAMAAKAKLLLKELKEAKAELTLAKEQCTKLEEENKKIRESLLNGSKSEEEDLVRIQLEILLAEKARLAQENAYYARENQLLRELLECHQLTLQQSNALFDETFLQECEVPFELDIEAYKTSSSESTTQAV